jgi:hypothetical protein
MGILVFLIIISGNTVGIIYLLVKQSGVVASKYPDYIWIEVDSQRFVSSMKITQIDEISSNIRETHDFVTDNGVKFLEQFDLAESPTDDDSDNDEDQDYDSDDNESGDD